MARRNYSAELLAAQKNGATIVCSVAPNDGTPVVYAPRRTRDPLPWTFQENGNSYQGLFRYTGRQCHAVPLTADEQFFFDHAGYAYNPDTETPRDGRLRSAKELAAAERWMRENSAYAAWTDDMEPLSGDCHDGTEYGWVANLYRYDTENGRQIFLSSLSSIDAPEGHPYRRVIVAQLAAEHI